MRTAEYYSIIDEKFHNEFMVEALETETEWGTKYYQWAVYVLGPLWETVRQAYGNKKDAAGAFTSEEIIEDICQDGAAAGLGTEAEKAMGINEDFGKAIEELFYYLYNNNYFENDEPSRTKMEKQNIQRKV